MSELLLELFSEEIPARMQGDAARNLQRLFEERLAGLAFDKINVFCGPRRIALVCAGLPDKTPDLNIERKGPKSDAPEAAVQGFLKSTGLKLEELEKRDGVYFAVKKEKGKPTAEALKPIIEEILAKFPWPKSMRWGANDVTWVRPLKNILCLFDGKILDVKFAHLQANDVTFGHRFLSGKEIKVKDFSGYKKELEKNFVILDQEERRNKIEEQASKIAAEKNLTIVKDEKLLDEVTGLVEWPEVLVGNIDQKFMHLPPEVLITSMRVHQKYFSLKPSPSGRGPRVEGLGPENVAGSPHPNPLPGGEGAGLAPHFMLVSNIKASDGGKAIIAGNERVLRARLSDAKFFYEQDLKKSLAEWAKGLAGVTFHNKIGTIAEKVGRVKLIAIELADIIKANKDQVARAAELCKADLVTGMVGEFAELQGLMGRYYALAQKEAPEVADAIRDHYKPVGAGDSVPKNPVSICVALADKLDTLIAMFAIGEKPTGSKDPFALRRAALGVIAIILENNLRIDLSKFVKPDLWEFFIDRLKVRLKEVPVNHDVVNAVLGNESHDIYLIANKAAAVQDFIYNNEDGKNLLIAYRRAANIVAAEEKKDKKSYKGQADKALLESPEEKALYELFNKVKPLINQKIKEEQFDLVMGHLATMRGAIDSFFDKTTVNSDKAGLRQNRLFILSELKTIMDDIADFSKVEG